MRGNSTTSIAQELSGRQRTVWLSVTRSEHSTGRARRRWWSNWRRFVRAWDSPDSGHRRNARCSRDSATSPCSTRNASSDRMRFVLTDVSRCCPNVRRILPSSSIRISVTSEYYPRTDRKAGENSTIWDSPSPEFILGGSGCRAVPSHVHRAPAILAREPVRSNSEIRTVPRLRGGPHARLTCAT